MLFFHIKNPFFLRGNVGKLESAILSIPQSQLNRDLDEVVDVVRCGEGEHRALALSFAPDTIGSTSLSYLLAGQLICDYVHLCMRRALRFVIALVLGLAFVTWVALSMVRGVV